MTPTLDTLHKAYAELGYPIDKDFNLFAIRAAVQSNSFNDLCGWFNMTAFECFEATTDSGLVFTHDGIASIKVGHYPDMYGFGFHKDRKDHPCFKQIGPAWYYRSKDGKQFPEETLFKGICGTNIHSTKPGFVPEDVDNWSRGCVVIRRWASLEKLLAKAHAAGREKFDFTMLKERNFGG